MTGICLAILSKLNRSHFRLVLDVQSEVSATRCNNEGFVILNIVESYYLSDGNVKFTGLEWHALELSILNLVGEYFTRLSANHQYSGVIVKGSSGDKLSRVLKLLRHLRFKSTRVEIEAIFASDEHVQLVALAILIDVDSFYLEVAWLRIFT